MVLGILNDEFVISAFDFVMVNVPNISIDFYNGDNLIAELMFDDVCVMEKVYGDIWERICGGNNFFDLSKINTTTGVWKGW